MRTTFLDAGRPAEKRRPARRALLIALFAAYLVLLVWIIVWKLELPHLGDPLTRTIKLVPFIATSANGASDPLEVLANLLLFLPFGVYLRMLAPSLPWWRVLCVLAGFSLALEIAQWMLAVGSSDITDVIVNTAGGLLGSGLAALAIPRLRSRTIALAGRICGAATAVAIVASVLFSLAPVHFGMVDAPPLSGDRQLHHP